MLQTFYQTTLLATVCSVLIMLACDIDSPLPIGRYPELAPPTVQVGAFYTGATRSGWRARSTTRSNRNQRRRGHVYMDLVFDNNASA